MAYTFSTSERQKVVRNPAVFFALLTWTCASRHNGFHFFDIVISESGPTVVSFVHFYLDMCFTPQRRAIFISYLATWLRTRRFSEVIFWPSGALNHWKKHSDLRLSYLFAHLHLLSSLIFSLLFFSSLTLPTSAFSNCPYCRKFHF